MKNLLIFSMLFLAFQFNAQAVIEGNVYDDKSGLPIIGATILYLDNVSIGTSSDADGKFSISLEDTYQSVEMLISCIGYEEKLVMLNPEVFNKISLAETSYQLSELTIKATKSVAEEFVYESFNKLDVYQNPSSRADPVRAVASLPSSSNIDETANLSLRGSSPFETGYMLNEVPVHDVFRLDQSNGVGQFSIFNTSIVSKVNVYPSNPPLEFGNSSSGLVSIYTDDFRGYNSNSVNLTLAGFGFNVSRSLGKKSSFVELLLPK